MTGFMLVLGAVLVLMAFPAYFSMGKKISAAFVFAAAVSAFASFILAGNMIAGVTASGFVSAFGFAVLFSEDEKETLKKITAFITAFLAVISVMFFGGCAKVVPASLSGKSINTGFIPSKIAVDENIIYAARLGGTDVLAINQADSKVIGEYKAGRNVTGMIVHDNRLYTANKLESSVSVIETGTGKSTKIKTDLFTAALALDAEHNTLYAANMGESSVTVINTAELKESGKIMTGRWPSALYLDKKSGLLYIACKYTNTLEIFDTKKGQMVFTEAHTGISPAAVLPVIGGRLAVLNEWEYAVNGKGRLTVFDTDGYTVSQSIPVAGGIAGGAVSKSGRYVYACVPLKDKVCVVDIRLSSVVAEINMPGFMPSMCAASKDGTRIFVGGLRQSSLEVINTGGMY